MPNKLLRLLLGIGHRVNGVGRMGTRNRYRAHQIGELAPEDSYYRNGDYRAFI